MELDGVLAVVTGGASGIGLALARRVLAEDGRVVLADVEEAALAAAVDELSGDGAPVWGIRTDVSDADSVGALAASVAERHGDVGLVFANAGVTASGAVWESTLDDWRWMLDVNVMGTVHCVRSFVPKSPQDMSHIQRMLASAGYHGEWGAILFSGVQITLPIVVFVAVVATFGFGSPVLFGAIAGALSYYVPVFWLGRRIDDRRREIRNGLPDATDLLIVCLEAGSGIDQAIARVAEELQIAYPSLARELELIGSETRAGKARMEAFKNFAERTKVDDARSLVAMLVQTDRFGTSIGQALRTHADSSRTKRRQRAEERAAKLGVKLLFPLVFCLFPAFFTVVLGPAMVQIYRQFIVELGSK